MKTLALVLLFCAACGCHRAAEVAIDEPTQNAELNASEEPNPQAIVILAIKAHGGESIERLKAGRFHLRTRSYRSHELLDDFSSEVSFQYPKQLRIVTTAAAPGTFKTIYQRNGDLAWEQSRDGSFGLVEELQGIQDIHPLKIIQELQTMGSGDYTLRYDGETTIKGRTLVTAGMSRDGVAIGAASFDKDTKLIAKWWYTAYDPRHRKNAIAEIIYEDYAAVGELQLPKKVTFYMDGEKFIEKTFQNFRLLKSIDRSEFVPAQTK